MPGAAWEAALDLLLSPPILFFLLGMAASLLKSDLDIPKPVTRLLSIYLLMAIGAYGGHKLAQSGLTAQALAVMGAAILASFAMPFATYPILRLRLPVHDAAAIAAAYGSISAVTFITAVSFLDSENIPYSGHLVASMALMESPAIVAGLLLVRHAIPKPARAATPSDAADEPAERGVWRDAALNGAVILLLGSMAIGFVCGEEGWAEIRPLMHDPFKGVLCIFLLEMGLVSARRIEDLRKAGVFLIAFGILGALAQGMLGVGVAWILGVGRGDALLLAILFGSASYIAVPAALRLAMPEANPSLYVPLPLAITFPFNIVVGIPMYHLLIGALGIGAAGG